MCPRSSFMRLATSMIILFSSSLAFLYLHFFLNPRHSQCAFHFSYMELQVDFKAPTRRLTSAPLLPWLFKETIRTRSSYEISELAEVSLFTISI